jgi:hypothetical protein
MKTLILTKDNLVTSEYNNEFRVDFNPTFNTVNHKLAFVNTQLYYSFFNVDAGLYQNNKISYYWIDGQKYDIFIEDGGYEISDIYQYIVIQLIKNKHYVVTSDNLYRYYFQISVNTSYYRVDINFFPLETLSEATEAGYSIPEGANWSFPESYSNIEDAFMRLEFDESYKTNELFGISQTGIFPSDETFAEKTSGMTTTTLDNFICYSDIDPQVHPSNNIIINCNRVENDLAIDNASRIFSFAPAVTFGSQMDIQANNFLFLNLQQGNFQTLSVTFTDESNRPLRLQDKVVNIQLAIRNEETDLDK